MDSKTTDIFKILGLIFLCALLLLLVKEIFIPSHIPPQITTIQNSIKNGLNDSESTTFKDLNSTEVGFKKVIRSEYSFFIPPEWNESKVIIGNCRRDVFIRPQNSGLISEEISVQTKSCLSSIDKPQIYEEKNGYIISLFYTGTDQRVLSEMKEVFKVVSKSFIIK